MFLSYICLFKIICGNIIHHPNRIYKLNFLRYDMHIKQKKDGFHMKEAIQTLLTSDKMAHAFEYLKQDEAHTIDQQIELVQISSFSPLREARDPF